MSTTALIQQLAENVKGKAEAAFAGKPVHAEEAAAASAASTKEKRVWSYEELLAGITRKSIGQLRLRAGIMRCEKGIDAHARHEIEAFLQKVARATMPRLTLAKKRTLSPEFLQSVLADIGHPVYGIAQRLSLLPPSGSAAATKASRQRSRDLKTASTAATIAVSTSSSAAATK